MINGVLISMATMPRKPAWPSCVTRVPPCRSPGLSPLSLPFCIPEPCPALSWGQWTGQCWPWGQVWDQALSWLRGSAFKLGCAVKTSRAKFSWCDQAEQHSRGKSSVPRTSQGLHLALTPRTLSNESLGWWLRCGQAPLKTLQGSCPCTWPASLYSPHTDPLLSQPPAERNDSL